jgi:PDZ domain-containing protein
VGPVTVRGTLGRTVEDPAYHLAPEEAEPRRRRARPWLLVVLALIGAALLAGSVVRVPYYAMAPGSAVDVEPLVSVDGGPSFEPEGSVYLTTVSLRQVTVFGAIRGWLDPDTDVVEEETIVPPDTDPDELRELNQRLMDSSKDAARGVAFEQLGYDAISGTGATVLDVVPRSPSDGVLQPDDTIVELAGEPVRIDGDVISLLDERSPGDLVDLVVERDGLPVPVQVELGRRPDARDQAFLGVGLSTRDLKLDFPYDVDIESERIGGPSAGLAFTLELLDVLTEGELTGGRQVAATGTIELDGSVGDVGGVAQKTAAVGAAGIDLFLVPRAELPHARRAAGGDLQVEPVDTLEDALRILARQGGNGLALDRPGERPS